MTDINFDKKTLGNIQSNSSTSNVYLETADFDNDGDLDIAATLVQDKS